MTCRPERRGEWPWPLRESLSIVSEGLVAVVPDDHPLAELRSDALAKAYCATRSCACPRVQASALCSTVPVLPGTCNRPSATIVDEAQPSGANILSAVFADKPGVQREGLPPTRCQLTSPWVRARGGDRAGGRRLVCGTSGQKICRKAAHKSSANELSTLLALPLKSKMTKAFALVIWCRRWDLNP